MTRGGHERRQHIWAVAAANLGSGDNTKVWSAAMAALRHCSVIVARGCVGSDGGHGGGT